MVHATTGKDVHEGFMIMAVLAVFSSAGVGVVSASPTVLNFDDLSTGYHLTGSSYGGLTWEVGNPGLNGILGRWDVPDSLFNYPYSAPHNAVNAFGSTLMGLSFPNAVDMGGAYVAVQGNGAWAQSLRVHGYLAGQPTVDTALFTQIGTTPTWFDMSALTNVDRIVFEASVVFQNQAAYGIDDLTFTYTPEPTALALSAAAGFGLLLRRRRSA